MPTFLETRFSDDRQIETLGTFTAFPPMSVSSLETDVLDPAIIIFWFISFFFLRYCLRSAFAAKWTTGAKIQETKAKHQATTEEEVPPVDSEFLKDMKKMLSMPLPASNDTIAWKQFFKEHIYSKPYY